MKGMKNSPLTISVVILNYNGAATLRACLHSVFSQQLPDTVRLHVIVVDNASTDDSLVIARQNFPAVECIKNARNVGFAAGNNVGIRFALERGTDYVFLLNNDAVLAPRALAALVRARTRRAAIYCPLITTPNGDVWYAGAKMRPLRMRVVHNRTRPRSQQRRRTAIATGCAMLIHKDVFTAIGLLNESYFLYYEDADFARCAARNNIPTYLVPTAQVVHKEVSNRTDARPTKIYWLTLSAILFFSAHAPLYARALYPIIIPLRRLKALIAPRSRDDAPHVRRALRDACKARKHYVRHC